MPGNQECADCGAPEPAWASVNQGVVICITCAGAHRSLGAHVSKVKSLSLDAWKEEEVQAFLAKGGNAEVNRKLLGRMQLPRPTKESSRADLDVYIIAKYTGVGPERQKKAFAPQSPQPGDGRYPSSPGSPYTDASGEDGEDNGLSGTTCHQGLIIAEVASVELSSERARELRLLGTMFLSLSASLALGQTTTERTEVRRGARTASWDPATRRQLLWDAEDPIQRWLWCRIHDGEDIMGEASLAAEGRVDLLGSGAARRNGDHHIMAGVPASLTVPLFAPLEDEDEEDEDGDEDLSDPARGRPCGEARVRLTIIDMSGLEKQK
jgi:hypothetical protein